MKKFMLLPILLFFGMMVFGQGTQKSSVATPKSNLHPSNNPDDPTAWKDGVATFNRRDIEIDTTFQDLHVELVSSKPAEFKLKRDKFSIYVPIDFKIDYLV